MSRLSYILNGHHNESYDRISKNGIYKIYILGKENKFYIGSASCITKVSKHTGFYLRWYHHIRKLRQNKHHSPLLQNVVNKYGLYNLRFEIIEIIEDISKILGREQYYLDLYKSYDRRFGYNILQNSQNMSGYKHTNICWRKPIIQYELNGNIISEFISARQVEEKLGYSYKMISSVCKGKNISYKGYIWRFKQDSFNKYPIFPKIDVSKKEVSQFTMDGKFVKTYKTITEASNITKITLSNISMCLRNQRQSAGGFKWKLAEALMKEENVRIKNLTENLK